MTAEAMSPELRQRLFDRAQVYQDLSSEIYLSARRRRDAGDPHWAIADAQEFAAECSWWARHCLLLLLEDLD